MKKIVLSLLSIAMTIGVYAQHHDHDHDANKNITPYHDGQDEINGLNIIDISKVAAWQQFSATYPSWGVNLNRFTKMPHRAFGEAISFAGGGNDPIAKAKAFLQQAFSGFNIPMNELVLTRNVNDGKYIHVDFKQVHNGVEVLWSRIAVRFTQDLKIVLVGIDAHKNIPSLSATITPAVAVQKAEEAISTPILNAEVKNDFKIFPYPGNGEYEYKLAYAVVVNTQDDKETPGKYLTYVDANTGDILYRQNQVKHIGFTVKADAYPTNLFSPLASLPLKNLRVNVGGTNYYTDLNGLVTVPGTAAVNPTISMIGKYITIVTGASGTTSATYSPTGVAGGSTVDFPHSSPNATERHMTCYYHANEIHDFMKAKLPAFTAMDNSLTARVDRTDGNCNAFYDGSSINFYTTASGCNALSLISDVMYHEYGHGITNVFWDDQGTSFDNGAMGEGYSDTWAFSITHSPIIGPGFNIGTPTSNIRRYDINPKVYPFDLVGQVHADGEIIAGAWWDTGVNWSVDSMSELFADTHYGLANGPDGQEGQVYHDILIDALQYDDDNSNLNDGTPHFGDIVPAFAAHGIYLLSNTQVLHNPPLAASPSSPVTINTTVSADYPAFLGDVRMIYRKKGTSISDSVLMTKSGTNYTCTFPVPLVAGDIYEYIFALYDYSNVLTMFAPLNSAFTNSSQQRNLPYYLISGYNTVYSQPFDTITSTTPDWTVGFAPNDNATSGRWIVAVPIPSITNGDTVQTGRDHTTGTGKCAVTGNAATPASVPGNADVDNGRTSLITQNFDISQYNQPILSYWRWYTNSQSSSDPGKDVWRVWLSYNDGATWNQVERTFKPDVSWRQQIVKLDPSLGNKVRLMFTATDSVYTGVTGTWVEAAVDDIEILDLGSSVGINEVNELKSSIYPNPANHEITISTSENGILSYSIVNTMGQTILQSNHAQINSNRLKVNTMSLSSGMYFVKLTMNGKQSIHRLLITK